MFSARNELGSTSSAVRGFGSKNSYALCKKDFLSLRAVSSSARGDADGTSGKPVSGLYDTD